MNDTQAQRRHMGTSEQQGETRMADNSITYQFETHQPSGELYAMQYRGLELIGVCGPLGFDERDGDMAEYDYTPEDVEWANGETWRVYEAVARSRFCVRLYDHTLHVAVIEYRHA